MTLPLRFIFGSYNLTIRLKMSPYVLRLAIADQGVTDTLQRALENHSNSLISNVALT